MQLLAFKNKVIGWMMIYLCIGFLPLAFSGELIHPFLLTAGAEVEKYNFIAGIVDCIQPIIGLSILHAVIIHFSKANIDKNVNEWVAQSLQDIDRVAIAILIFRTKELLDYITYENVVPDCFNPFWFLILWELGPIVLLMIWAVAIPKLNNR